MSTVTVAPALARIGDLIDEVDTCNPERADPSSTFVYVDLSSIDESKQIGTPRRIKAADAPSRARQRIKADDVLVSTVRPNLNGVARVPHELDGAIASTGFCVLRPRSSLLCSGYLFQWVKSPWFIGEMTRRATGASYPAVTESIVFDSTIPLPPLPAQRRIAAILDKADALRAKRQKAVESLDLLARSTFSALFAGTNQFPETRLDQLVQHNRGSFVNGPFGSHLLTSELTSEGVPVIYIRDIREGRYRRVSGVCVSERKAKQLDVCRVDAGDVLVAKVGDPPGVAALYPSTEPSGIVTQDVIRLRLDSTVATPEYVIAYLNSEIGRHTIAGITVEATRSRFSLGDFKALRIRLPPIAVQRRFATQIQAVERLHERQATSTHAYDALFASLQQRAFTGTL